MGKDNLNLPIDVLEDNNYNRKPSMQIEYIQKYSQKRYRVVEKEYQQGS